jgi:pimeloyl-ACP methyl ester carboxylesterase
VGLAGWILSFGSTGAGSDDLDNGIERAFGGRDELLTNIMTYWVTETGGSAARTYLAEAQGTEWGAPPPPRSDVPAAFALFPREAPTPRDWVARQTNLQRYTEMPKGGHFAALEEPELFVNDLREFFGDLRVA